MAPTRARANNEDAKGEVTTKERQTNSSTKPRRMGPSATTTNNAGHNTSKHAHANHSTTIGVTSNGVHGEHINEVSTSAVCQSQYPRADVSIIA